MSQTPLTTKYSGVLRTLSAAEAENLDDRGIPKKLGRLYRRVRVAGYDKEAGTVTMAVSSETPVERGYGQEILSHSKGAIRTGRLEGGVSLLFNHKYDLLLGRSVSFEVGKQIHVTCKFGPSDLATEKQREVEAEVLVDVSIGYIVYEWEITEDKNGVRTYLAVDWEILEVSLVTVPADPTVGVGRAAEDAVDVKVRSFTSERSESDSDDEDDEDDDEEDDDEGERSLPADPAPISEPPTPNPAPQRTVTMAEEVVVTPTPAELETQRVAGIKALRTQYPEHLSETAERTAIALDVPVGKLKERIADEIINASQRTNVQTVAEELFGSMTPKERSRYSLRNAYVAALNQRTPGASAIAVDAKFEEEVSNELRKQGEKRGIEGLGTGILIPSASTRTALAQERTIASGGNAGTYTNFTDVAADPIELLRSRVFIMALGATFMTGLKGKIQLPRQNGAASSNWLAEGSAATNSDLTLDDIVMQPNRLSMQNSYYRDFLAQSALAIDGLLSSDRMAVLARALNTAAIAGSGTAPVPLGLLNRGGLAAVLAGTTRAANGTVTAGLGGVPMTYVDYNAMESAIATSNGDTGTMRWLTTPKVRGAARSTPKIPGTSSDFVWPDSVRGENGLQTGPLGYEALCTSNSALTGFTANSVANLHAVILGVWDQMLIGDWGLSELIVDNITGAASAKVIITEHGFYDTNIRHLESFVACTSALPS